MKGSFFYLCLVFSLTAFAQSRENLSFGVSVNPTVTYGINTASSNEPINSHSTVTNKQYSDSLKKSDTYKFSMGATLWVNYLLSRKWSLQAGVGYSEVGFTRQQKGLKFQDKLFPGVGSSSQIQDRSFDEKNVDYSFRFQYLSVPVLFNYYSKRSRDFKWSYYLSMGAALNILLKDQLRAKLNNFYIEGENVYNIDSTGYEAHPVTLNLFLGGKVEYKINQQFTAFGQPMLTVFPLSVSKTELKSRPVGVQLNIGVSYNINGGGRDE